MGVKRQEREAYHWTTSTAEVKNSWRYTSSPLYVFTTSYLNTFCKWEEVYFRSWSIMCSSVQWSSFPRHLIALPVDKASLNGPSKNRELETLSSVTMKIFKFHWIIEISRNICRSWKHKFFKYGIFFDTTGHFEPAFMLHMTADSHMFPLLISRNKIIHHV